MIRDVVKQMAEGWRKLGRPSLLDEFVLKHGKVFEGVKRPTGFRKLSAHQCFANCTNHILIKQTPDVEYYEGYTMSRSIGIPILHAWLVRNGEVIDVTLKNPAEYEYIGVYFDRKTLHREVVKNDVYGILEGDGFVNVALLKSLDAELVDWVTLQIHRASGK